MTKKEFRSFEDAKEIIHLLKLKTQKEWQMFCSSGKKPQDIPSIPNRTYKNKGWTTWGDWLGTGKIATQNIEYRSFKESRKFTRKLNLKTQKQWHEY